MPAPSAATKKNQKARRYLADDYEPHENDVLIGRGRRVETHNVKFRAMIRSHLAAYYNAQTKATKSTIILRIFQQVKRGGGTGFIKSEASTRRWFAIEDAAARISIAQAFRDALSSEYKSSKQYKQQKRKEERGECGPLDFLTLNSMGNRNMCDDNTPLFAPSFGRQVSGDSCMALPSFGRQVSGDGMNLSMPSLVPPSLVPVVSCDGRDLGRPASLHAILERATRVVNSVESESLLRNGGGVSAAAADEQVPQEDLLAGLEQAVGFGSFDLNSNPFEPTPLKEQEARPSSDDLLFGDGDADLMDLQRQSFTLGSSNSSSKPDSSFEDMFQVFDMNHVLSV